MDTEWFKARKRELKVTDAALGEALGVERSVANRVINGVVEFNAKKVEAVASLLKVQPDEILYRTGISKQTPVSLPSDHQPTRTLDVGETVEIAALDLSFPMGPGATVDDYVEEERLRFDLGYVRTFTRTPAHRLRIARGVGESMWPTLVSSDLVWIDSTQTILNQQDRIWAVSIHGAAAIKRLRALGKGKVLVISDNQAVDNYEVDASDLIIGGRVIRFARDV